MNRRPTGLPVVTVVPHTGAASPLATAITDRAATARAVASPTGAVDLRLDPESGEHVIVVTPSAGPDAWTLTPVPEQAQPPGRTVATPAPVEPATDGEFDRQALAVDRDHFLGALAAVLRRDAPASLPPAASAPAGAEGLRGWLERRLADDTEAAAGLGGLGAAPVIDPDEILTTRELGRVGATRTELTQATLQGGRVRAGDVQLTARQQLRILLGRPEGARSAPVIEALATVLAAELGVTFTLVDAARHRLVIGPGGRGPAVSLDVHQLYVLRQPEVVQG